MLISASELSGLLTWNKYTVQIGISLLIGCLYQVCASESTNARDSQATNIFGGRSVVEAFNFLYQQISFNVFSRSDYIYIAEISSQGPLNQGASLAVISYIIKFHFASSIDWDYNAAAASY